MKILPALPAVLSILLAISLPLRAQSPAAAQENEAAYALFSAADYKGAAAAYEAIVNGYPTDIVAQTAQIQLALCQFYLAEFDKALSTLDKTNSGPPLTGDSAALVDNLRPQILAAKAMSLPPGDTARKGLFEEAIKGYSEFTAKHPRSPELESAAYGRALCEFQIGEFDKAAASLRENIAKFATSGTIDSSKNLLAITLATQGGEALTKDGGDKEAGLAKLQEAEEILRGIIDGKKDLALVNDANFQLGEILSMRAAFTPEADRQPIYEQAAAAYMAVLPKETIVALQDEKVKSFASRKRAALAARDIALKKKLDLENERELRKLAEVGAKPDQTAPALLKLGEILFNAGKYNSSRVVLNHVSPFLATPDEKMRAVYFRTMGYAVQGAAEPAAKGYEGFQAEFKGKPLAENLPFVIGNMFLSQGDSESAIRYFDESLQIYPQGRLAGLSVAQKAQAQVGLKQYEEALKTFTDCLANNPSPEVGVVAQSGIANIHRDTANWDAAIAAYQETISKYPGTPQATDAPYWIAVCTQQKGDNAAAADQLAKFISENPGNALIPLATFALGNAQIATGKKDEGLATLAKVADEFPDSQPAPFSYFARAQVHGADSNAEKINELMRAFIEKYPQDDKVFFAYSSIAQNEASAGKPAEAAAAWNEFAEKYPDHPNAASSIVKVADLQRAQAEQLATNPTSLPPEDREKWNASIAASDATIAGLLEKYPRSPDLAAGLQSYLANRRLLVSAGIQQPAGVEAAFTELAQKTTAESARSQILFTLAAYISETDKPRALAKMSEAYNPQVAYSPKDIDIYGLALADGGKPDEALAVFEKLAADYPVPAGVEPNAAPPTVQEAQAVAIFGKARVAQSRGETEAAGQLFQQLKQTYPWSPKVLEADYGIAQSLKAAGKGDEAMPMLGAIIRAQNATAELRANSFLLYGDIMKEKYERESDPKAKADNLGSAIDYYLKIPQFYSGVPAAAAKGLWQGGQLLEAQIQTLTEETQPKKSEQLAKARLAYEQLAKDYPNDPLATEAANRLQALTAP